MISIVIPAHNEAAVIARCLSALLTGDDRFEIIVVANGCSDATAEIARSFGSAVKVLQTETASKTNALNLGDAAASGFPRLYLDADVVISARSVRLVGEALLGSAPLMAAPTVAVQFPAKASWFVRRYYDLWMSLPYVREGLVTAGVYGLNASGRARFEAFPSVLADDSYVRFHFRKAERLQVEGAVSQVTMPGSFVDLIRTRTRARLGLLQLRRLYPELLQSEMRPSRYLSSLFEVVGKPALYPGACLYLLVRAVSEYRARRQAQLISAYAWERDDSSRESAEPVGREAGAAWHET